WKHRGTQSGATQPDVCRNSECHRPLRLPEPPCRARLFHRRLAMTKDRRACGLLLATSLAIFLCTCARREQPVSGASANLEPSVPAVRVKRIDLSGSITLTGEFVPFQEVDVMANVSGYI